MEIKFMADSKGTHIVMMRWISMMARDAIVNRFASILQLVIIAHDYLLSVHMHGEIRGS